MQQVPANGQTAYRYKPAFQKEVYRCNVNGRFLLKKFHLSGILFFKEMKNGTVHAIFQNEMGFSFFDFEWDEQGRFKVNSIIEQLNKPAIVKTLKKDFNLLLMNELDSNSEKIYRGRRGEEMNYCFSLGGGVAYYIVNAGRLDRIENAGKRKKVITINVKGKQGNTVMPDTVLFTHHKANFTIGLHKMRDYVDE
ncbi:hypothetical protein CAP35_08660 [Chitinophagaceae bacterium IBVUCB1]|nr:hypothetical protein CAP35_08660 [Chitinophagaceae bacterium IBVUCB1]